MASGITLRHPCIPPCSAASVVPIRIFGHATPKRSKQARAGQIDPARRRGIGDHPPPFLQPRPRPHPAPRSPRVRCGLPFSQSRRRSACRTARRRGASRAGRTRRGGSTGEAPVCWSIPRSRDRWAWDSPHSRPVARMPPPGALRGREPEAEAPAPSHKWHERLARAPPSAAADAHQIIDFVAPSGRAASPKRRATRASQRAAAGHPGASPALAQGQPGRPPGPAWHAHRLWARPGGSGRAGQWYTRPPRHLSKHGPGQHVATFRDVERQPDDRVPSFVQLEPPRTQPRFTRCRLLALTLRQPHTCCMRILSTRGCMASSCPANEAKSHVCSTRPL